MGKFGTKLTSVALAALLAAGMSPASALAMQPSGTPTAQADASSERQPSAAAQSRANQQLAEAKADLTKAGDALTAAQKALSDANDAVAAKQEAYDGAVAALDAAQAELEQYKELAKKGSLGFFEEIGATTAVKYLIDPEKWFDEEYRASGVGTDPNNLDTGATSLENMKLALETMSKVNDIRKANGLAELGISSAMMAAGQVNLNYSISHKPFDHAPSNIGGGENIAWGYKDPFVGWYDEEKALYDKDMEDGSLDHPEEVGHYFNILEKGYNFYGCAQVGTATLQEFTGSTAKDIKRLYGEDPYTADEYYQLFMAYYNKVYGQLDPTYQKAVDEAKAALEAAQADAAMSEANLSAAEAAQKQAQQAVSEAQAAVDAANAGKTIVQRIAGNEAEQTAVAISQQAFPSYAGTIVIARSDDFADSMSATGLAGLTNAPILLVDRNAGASAETLAEIERLHPLQAYVVGGPGAIPAMDTLRDQLRNAGVMRVENVYGNDAADTSAKCAARICEIKGTTSSPMPEYAVVAMSDNFQDALSMSSFAYKYHAPIILLTSSQTAAGRHLTAESAELLRTGALSGAKIFVAGGTGAVPNSALTDQGLRPFQRLAGSDGYDTSNQIAGYMVTNGLLSAETVTLACGAEEAKGLDALAGAALAGKNGGVMLLASTQPDYGAASLQTVRGRDSEGASALIESHDRSVYWVDVLGGEYVMPQSLVDTVKDTVL